MPMVSKVSGVTSTTMSASAQTWSASAIATVSSAPSTGRPDRLTAVMCGPKGWSMEMSSRPMPPAPKIATRLLRNSQSCRESISRRMEKEDVSKTYLYWCSEASIRAIACSATGLAKTPAALAQRVPGFITPLLSSCSTPVNTHWTKRTFSGSGSGSGPPL